MNINKRLDEIVAKLQNPSQMRLIMGELNAAELLVAQAAIRYAVYNIMVFEFDFIDKEKLLT